MSKSQLPSERPTSPHPLFNLGFRIFFSGAALFACLTMLVWGFMFTGKINFDVLTINPFYWHAHEMFYGYALAVIAGFLLTAVKTWTGVMMPYGYRLMGIFGCWVLARLCWLAVGLGIGSPVMDTVGNTLSSATGNTQFWLLMAMLADMVFLGWTAWVITNAVLAVKQYKQMGIVSKLLLLLAGNALCYWGIYSGNMTYMRMGVYLGLYLVIGMVLTIGRRVVPFFIERGIDSDSDESVVLKNSNLLDGLSLLTFLIFMVADVFMPNKILITISAGSVALVNFIRVAGWYHKGLWSKPLLWSLYVAFLGMCSSFILFAIQPWLGFNHSLAVHALALSGVGLMTLAMMTRVSLGHTGRSIHNPPKTVVVMFGLMILAFIFRVIMPLIAIDEYSTWLMLAQSAWIGSFALFCISYLPILAAPRTDKLFG